MKFPKFPWEDPINAVKFMIELFREASPWAIDWLDDAINDFLKHDGAPPWDYTWFQRVDKRFAAVDSDINDLAIRLVRTLYSHSSSVRWGNISDPTVYEAAFFDIVKNRTPVSEDRIRAAYIKWRAFDAFEGSVSDDVLAAFDAIWMAQDYVGAYRLAEQLRVASE